ncbi:hypothetical protein [Vibrio harveyi]|uniref:hypothetical protein n=1 Tax=Vibrio harveyi TaxID=669 RepID=UPI000B2FAEF2|nr:hypothetical protein [Vibrio harveyi]
MSAVAITRPSFVLFARNNDDIVKARPFEGDHGKIIQRALNETKTKQAHTIKELAKV